MAMDAMPSGSQADHHVTDHANFIRTVKADPTAAINSGMMQQKTQEVPFGGIGKAVAQGVEKVVAKIAARDAASTAAKVESRALKAANEPTRASKTSLGSNEKVAPSVRSNILKNEAPANPNVTRGGSAGSKLNWPESMK